MNLKKTHALSLFHMFALCLAEPRIAIAGEALPSTLGYDSQQDGWCQERLDCSELGFAPLLGENPSVDELECKMLEYGARCAYLIESKECERFNNTAAQLGEISESVAIQATRKGICTISHEFMGILALCPGEDHSSSWSCEDQGKELPPNPTLNQIQCHLKQLKKSGPYTWPSVSFKECKGLNEHAAAQGLVSKQVAEQATERGLCLLAPASLHRIVTVWEICAS